MYIYYVITNHKSAVILSLTQLTFLMILLHSLTMFNCLARVVFIGTGKRMHVPDMT